MQIIRRSYTIYGRTPNCGEIITVITEAKWFLCVATTFLFPTCRTFLLHIFRLDWKINTAMPRVGIAVHRLTEK